MAQSDRKTHFGTAPSGSASSGALGAMLVTLAPVAVPLALALVRPRWALPAGLLAAALIALGAATHERLGFGRWLGVIGLAVVPAAAFDRLLASPGLALAMISVVTVASWALFGTPARLAAALAISVPSESLRRLARLRAACAAALLVWFSVSVLQVSYVGLARTALAASVLVAIGFVIAWLPRSRAAIREAGWSPWVIGAIALMAVAGAIQLPEIALAAMAAIPASALLLARGANDDARNVGWISTILDHPARLVVTTFLLLCIAGTGLLVLPLSSTSGTSIGALDAAFTATSAVCVTGLIVLDTPSAFTDFGQSVIVVLIQVGGLGIMSFYTVALRFFGRRLSLRHELTVAGAVGVESATLFGTLRRVLLVTFLAEIVGAGLLTLAFVWEGEMLEGAIWRGVFTAISAFCNAGFALQTDSLIPHQQNPLVLYTVATLIIAGGLSPLAIVTLPNLLRRKRIPLQVKLIYATSALLLVVGTLAYAAFEWSHSLGHLPFGARVHNAWFQSVTTRTAGFNSVDLNQITDATRTLVMTLMLIGGSPGGTAGGLKTTTVTVLALAVVATLRGRAQVVAFGRHIRHSSVYKAAAVATVGVLSVIGGVTALQLTQRMPFEVAVFEVISALGTVGLTIGGTPLLDGVGKVLIMICMFMGRIGPLTLFLFLADRRPEPDWDYPDEDVDVG